MNSAWPDDPGESSNPPNRGSATKIVLIIVGVIIGCGVLCIACCGGLVFFGIKTVGAAARDVPAAKAAADSLLSDLQTDKIQEAYAKTTPAFQQQQTLEQFGEFVSRFEILKTHTSRTFNNFHFFQGTNGKQVTLKTTLRTENNALSCTFLFVEQDDKWLVTKLTVP